MKLTKKDVFRTWVSWMWHIQACYNYEKMQGLGFLHAMCPALGKLYAKDLEGRKAAMERHMDFFNTETVFGSAIVGLSLAMEEEVANGADMDPNAVRSIKTGLMGPLAGIGDSMMQGVVTPLVLAFFLEMGLSGNIAAPIIYAIVMFLIICVPAYFLFMLGDKKGGEAVRGMLESGTLKKIIRIAGIIGCMALGALVCSYVSVVCGIELTQADGTVFSLQSNLFDAILPGILPLGMTMLCYKLLQKGKSSIWVLVFLIAIGAVGGLTGILAW